MRKAIVFLLLSLALLPASTIQAQTKPDFSGTWIRESAKSQMTGPMTTPLPKIPTDTTKVVLTITHKEPELKIVRATTDSGQESETIFVYYTNGSGENNSAIFNQAGGIESYSQQGQWGLIKTKTQWDGAKLTSRYSVNFSVTSNTVHIDGKEVKELSADGKTLTINYTSNRDGYILKTKEVFKRVP